MLHPVVKPAAISVAGSDQNAQLWQGDVRLINALSHVNWTDTDANFQFEVCETCGYPGCEPGGWVSLRRVGAMKGSFLEQVPIVTELLNQLLESADSVAVQLIAPQKAVAFYLDLAGIPQWNALISDGDSYSLYVEPGYVLITD